MDNCVRPKRQRWRQLASVTSAVIFVFVSACYLFQPDWLAPVILVPPWCWLIPGLLLAACGYRGTHKLLFLGLLALWGLFIGLFVEEAYSLVRRASLPTDAWLAARENGRGIRVVSLNCHLGQSPGVEELAQWDPDIVLLQESPSSERLAELSQILFGSDAELLHGGDVSIMTRGHLKSKYSMASSHFVHAEIEFPTGFRTDVLSVRLAPPVSRLDFWMRDFWVDHRKRRMKHRDQIVDIMRHVRDVSEGRQLIVGGDFNSPPYDDSLAPLERRLSDTFRSAGRGWGATGTNDYPIFRVDQIWASEGYHPSSVTARKTRFSDHRMVICDLRIVE